MADTPVPEPSTPVETEPETLLYEERRSALRWPLVVPSAVGALLLVGGIVLTATVQTSILPPFAALAGLILVIFTTAPYLVNRHTGIRFTTRQLIIGAVHLIDNRPDPLRPRNGLASLGSAAFSCDWEDILSLRLETDLKKLRLMRADPGNLGGPKDYMIGMGNERRLGMVVSPYAKAVLLIHVRVDSAHFPALVAGKRLTNIHSPIWAVPTRRPEELAKVLAAFPRTSRFDLTAPLDWDWPY